MPNFPFGVYSSVVLLVQPWTFVEQWPRRHVPSLWKIMYRRLLLSHTPSKFFPFSFSKRTSRHLERTSKIFQRHVIDDQRKSHLHVISRGCICYSAVLIVSLCKKKVAPISYWEARLWQMHSNLFLLTCWYQDRTDPVVALWVCGRGVFLIYNSISYCFFSNMTSICLLVVWKSFEINSCSEKAIGKNIIENVSTMQNIYTKSYRIS